MQLHGKKLFRTMYEKSVHIRSQSGPHFPTFGLNTERYGVFSPKAGKFGIG